jgi:5-methyltetrahydrofolate--homocysteine methyltransferase
MNILEYCKNHKLILDGGMGSLLMAEGMKPGENTASWALSHPDVIKRIHMDYYRAGSDAVLSDTFSANVYKYSQEELEKVLGAACMLAAQARDEAAKALRTTCHAKGPTDGKDGTPDSFVAENAADICESAGSGRCLFWGFDMGPLDEMLEPFGDLEYDEAVEAFAVNVRIAEVYEPDFYFIETMNDKAQTLAALQAVKENSARPVFVSNTYDERGKLFTGASPEEMVEAIEKGGADALGINCSFGPAGLMPILKIYLDNAHKPVFFKPNAGIPHLLNGKTVYDLTPEEFAKEVAPALQMGVRIVGGCCGTTPEYIATVASILNK